jgi:hypothetical protein
VAGGCRSARHAPITSQRPSRISGQKILADLRLAARKGDRSALTLALDAMRTLAQSPRYWEKYLGLLRNPSARLVDLLVIKQGERIAHQKGWKKLGMGSRPPAESSPHDSKKGQSARSKRPTPARGRRPTASQPSLFDL